MRIRGDGKSERLRRYKLEIEHARIIELISKLTEKQRRDLVRLLHERRLLDDDSSFLTPEQRAIVVQRMAEADQDENIPSEQVWRELAEKHGLRRP